jgi:hypothetical protein
MRSDGSLRLKLLGGAAGILVGAALATAWFAIASTPSWRLGATDVVGTLSGGEPAGGNGGKLSDQADALSSIVEVRLRANEFDKALVLLQQANSLKLRERDQVYEKAADVVLKPAQAGGDEKYRETYLSDNGGRAAVLARLPYLYKMVRQVPDSAVKVTLLLRTSNVGELVRLGGGTAVQAPEALPGSEQLMDEASRIAHGLPAETSPWFPWAIGSVLTVALAFLGLVFAEVILECARCVAREIAKEFGLGRFRKSEPEGRSGTVTGGADGTEPASSLGAAPARPDEPPARGNLQDPGQTHAQDSGPGEADRRAAGEDGRGM